MVGDPFRLSFNYRPANSAGLFYSAQVMHRSSRFRFLITPPTPFLVEIARDLCTYAGPCLFRWITSCLPRVLCVSFLQGGIGSIGLLSFLFKGVGIVIEKSF